MNNNDDLLELNKLDPTGCYIEWIYKLKGLKKEVSLISDTSNDLGLRSLDDKDS